MKRINVIGTTGSGKSAFAKRLSVKLGYSCIQMDQLFWKPHWEMSSDEEFEANLCKAISGECWILDGNYTRTESIKWSEADTVIWIDYSYGRTLWQLFKRTVGRVWAGGELWEETGNTESFRRSFLSRNSIFIWFFRCYRKNRIRYVELMEAPNDYDLKFVRLRSPSEAQEFIESVCADRSTLPLRFL